MTVNTSPLERLRASLAANQPNLDGLLITKPENRSYLSGFTGTFGYLVVTQHDAVLMTDGRYTEQAAAQAQGWTIVRLQRPYEDALISELKRLSIKNLGFESDNLTFAEYASWTQKLSGTEWTPTSGIVAQLRRYKTPKELENIRKAVSIAETAFENTLNILKVGMTERQAAAELEYAMRKGGADAIAFETTVVSGVRTSLPHGKPTDKQIEAGDFITFDFGARFSAYNSDITRTIFVGGGKEPTKRQREVYELVLKAQLAGIEAVRPGVSCNSVDKVSRDIFEEAGLAEYFVHSLGHNLGREVHEMPLLAATDTSMVEAGMVLTIEPGLYIGNWGGVRIEDDLYIGENGPEVLPHLTKELILL